VLKYYLKEVLFTVGFPLQNITQQQAFLPNWNPASFTILSFIPLPYPSWKFNLLFWINSPFPQLRYFAVVQSCDKNTNLFALTMSITAHQITYSFRIGVERFGVYSVSTVIFNDTRIDSNHW